MREAHILKRGDQSLFRNLNWAPWIEPIWHFHIGGAAESQRDSAKKPRVARNELPWDYASRSTTTLKGLRPTATAAQRGRNPVGVVKHRPPLPRVARPSQPWALLRNPFGILSGNLCQVPGIMRHTFLSDCGSPSAPAIELLSQSALITSIAVDYSRRAAVGDL